MIILFRCITRCGKLTDYTELSNCYMHVYTFEDSVIARGNWTVEGGGGGAWPQPSILKHMQLV